jgi:dihydroxy-acid dehydratase
MRPVPTRRWRAPRPANYGDPEFSLFVRGAYARGSGLTAEDLGRPIIGIAQTWSEFNLSPASPEVAESVKRRVWPADCRLES